MSEVKVVSIEGVLPPTVVSKNRAVNVAYLFPRGNLVVQESLDALGVAIEESIANGETQMIADMVTLHVNLTPQHRWNGMPNQAPPSVFSIR
jgi:hypothetical protein